MTTSIEFFFQFSSPYGSAASERIDKLAGYMPKHIKAGIQPKSLSRQLRAVNSEVRVQGVFVSPALFINQEPSWGVDHSGHLDQQLSRGSW